MNPFVAFALLAGGVFVARLLSRRLCRVLRRERPNFRGDVIPASAGLTHLLVCSIAYGVPGAWPEAVRDRLPAFLGVVVAFGLLGLADDLWGSRAVGGFRGHLGSLFRGRPTTGAAKLLGGGAAALAAAWALDGLQPVPLVTDAALIALAANSLNLLDVRPGRAQAGFVVLCLASLLAGGPSAALLLPPGAAVAAEWRDDARARAMMGDTGSNLLGALAGLAAACALPLAGRVALALALFTLNAVAERVSLTAVIERTPWLARIDGWLGVRGG